MCDVGRLRCSRKQGVVVRARKNRKSTVAGLAVVMTITALMSCGETPGWRDAGVRQVRVEELTVPDTVASDEVLPIQLFGRTQPWGVLTLNRIDVIRESTEIELTVWAEVRVWVGSAPPPCDCGIEVDYQVPPPFDPGEFRVVINQPDGSQLVESVLIEP